MILSNKQIPRRLLNGFNKCAEYSKKGQMRIQHCACLIKNGRIYNLNVNKYSHKKFISNSIHAEEGLIYKLRNKKTTTKYDLIIVRINQKGELVNSAPCKKCSELIRNAPFISKVYFSGKDGAIHALRKKQIYSEHISIGQKFL